MPKRTILLVQPTCDYGTEKEADIIAKMQKEGVEVINLNGATQSISELVALCDKCCFSGFDHDLEADEIPSGWLKSEAGGITVNRPARRIPFDVASTVEDFYEADKPVYYMTYDVIEDGGRVLFKQVIPLEADSWDGEYILLDELQTEALLEAATENA
ncbi:MAG: hypothetical protein OSB62_04040 [Alphaproteobacteria bacterium]|nr:hypothetical protein [Alphaproteobacteria bacterium]